MKKLTHDMLTALGQEAERSPRYRMNHNMHTELADSVQRLAIAMEPETYIRPHRHVHTWELLTPLKGRFLVLHFDETGQVQGRTAGKVVDLDVVAFMGGSIFFGQVCID